jgi:two-component system cell cycle response regulator
MPARILIIEDNEANLELMSYLLRAYGHVIVAARDGHEGLDIARRKEADLILCDIQLPKIGGMEIASRLRGEVTFRGIPLIAVTALAMVGDRETIMAAGFDGYITKPIEPTSFAHQVDAFLPQERRGQASVSVPTTEAGQRPASRGRRVLVVDDQPVNLELAQSLLSGSGYEVSTASSVAQALTSASRLMPDLIMSDVCMGDASGFDLIAAVKAHAQLGSIPFIFLTSTMITEEARRKGLALGAARFIFRPIEPSELLHEIAACLGDAQRS